VYIKPKAMKNSILYNFLVLLIFLTAATTQATAQSLVEAPIPEAKVIDKNDVEEWLSEGESFTGEAPLKVSFIANADEYKDYTCVCAWRFTRDEEREPFLTRYDKEVDYDFDEAGSFMVQLHVTYSHNENKNLVLEYEYEPFQIVISESSLKVPNAFSPNGDGINDYFNVFEVKSIISFSAAIYNRWGQQLYKWGIDKMDCETCGWDGTYNGSPVKDGVYYVVVQARGADGINYNIRSDVNLLRGYTEDISN
jgi:gliding motility-associated-like protein